MKKRIIVGGKPRTVTAPVALDIVTNPSLRTPKASTLEGPNRSNQPVSGEAFGSEFLDNVAHQMVAPLQSIQMNCQNIIDGLVPQEEHTTRLKEVVGHSKILADLARRMRFLHELVSGKTIDTERLRFRDITTAWIDSFNNYLPAMREMNVEVDIHHKKMNKLPEVVASRLAAHQVIMNLYDNALKYGAPNSRIDVSAVRDGDYVINRFRHRARIQITPQAVGQLFERGFRAEEAKKLRAAGTGIGMWISRSLMRAMQGDLTALPTDNTGFTSFLVKWKVH